MANEPARRFRAARVASGKRQSVLNVLVNEVRDHLGIGLRAEAPPPGEQFVAQLQIVFNNAVVDDHHLSGAVRVGVLLGRSSVGGPAGMANADCALDRLGAQDVVEVLQLADRAPQHNPVAGHRQPGRVIAPVGQTLQPLVQQRGGLTVADIADNAAHGPGP